MSTISDVIGFNPAPWMADALGRGIKPRNTDAWNAVLADAQRTADRHHQRTIEAQP